MEEMASRERKKETRLLGNHPGKWLTDVERFRTVSRQMPELKALEQRIDAVPEEAVKEWMAKESWLLEYCRQLTSRMRDRLPPATFREMNNPLEWLENPESLSSDPRCWGYLGALDAVSALYVTMVASRIGTTRIDLAMKDLVAKFRPFRARAMTLYREVQEMCVVLNPEAEPKSLFVTIGQEQGCPLLAVTFESRQETGG